MEFISPIQNLNQHLSNLAEKHPNNPALLSCDQEGNILECYTYQKLRQTVNNIGSWFTYDLNLRPNDVLGLALYNCAELLLASWTAWSLGVITAPLDVRRDSFKQHVYKIRATRPKVLIAENGIFTVSEVGTKVINVKQISSLPESYKAVNWQNGTDHRALILFTSGTTAHPKGARLTLKNLIANADGIKDWFKITHADRFMALLPLHHINSTSFCLANLLAGSSIALPPSYSRSKFWKQIANSGSTFTSIVPTICYDQLSQTNEFDKVKDKLKINRIQIGSAPVVASDVKKFVEMFKIPVYQGYGQTETALRVTGVPLDLGLQIYQKLRDENSIGKPMKWAEVAIMNVDNILLENQEGEVAVKGPIVMEGYLNNNDNHEAFKNGYFLTGDLGYYKLINNEPYFFLKGRLKEIIIKGGVNLSPVSIEDRLKQINSDIDQVYAIGLPDKRYGQEVAAIVLWKENDNISELESNLKYMLTGPLEDIKTFEVPKFIATISADELPITSTGKVQRSALKNMLHADRFQPTNLIVSNKRYKFLRLTEDNKPYLKQAFDMFNYCWGPLTIDMEAFRQQVMNGVVIMCISEEDKAEGIITLLRTSLGEGELSKLTYKELTGNLTLTTNQKGGDKIVCVSICSSNYKPQKLMGVDTIPDVKMIHDYLLSGLDTVYNFHLKPKGGIGGAKLLAVMPNSRPEDRMSLGYNLLLEYPLLPDKLIIPNAEASVAVQLIEAAMNFAQQLDIYKIFAFSRPAGASHYFYKNAVKR